MVLIAYLSLAPAHVVAPDNAEFATLGALGGRAHPSGYPLYVLWLRATSWLPAASSAHTASLATALLAAIQVVVLHAACRAWGTRASAATLAVAIFAGAPFVIRVHTEADVFALASLVGATVLWLSAPACPIRGTKRAALLGLVAGLGLANNLIAALLAPVGIYGVVRGIRESTSRPRAIALAVGGLVVGLLPYAYLFVAPDAASWGPVESFGDLLDVFLRADYGYFAHVPNSTPLPLGTSLPAHAMLVGRIWLWLPALLGLVALGVRCRRDDNRRAWWALAASWFVIGPLLATRLDVPVHGVGAYIGGRMQILSAVVLAIPIASGFELVGKQMKVTLSTLRVAIVAIAVFVVLAAIAYPRLARVHSPAMETGVRTMLRALPAKAIAVVVSEDLCFAGRYLQLVEGSRPDVALVCWQLVSRAWYRDRVARTMGLQLAATAGGPAEVAHAEALLATGRPVLVDRAQPLVLEALPHYPVGILLQIEARGTKTPSLAEVVESNREIFATIDFDYPRPTRDDDLAAVAHLRYAQTWQLIATESRKAGDAAGAAAAHELALSLAPE